MLSASLSRRLAPPIFKTARLSSSVATVASSTARHDLALEARRAARLARESLPQHRSEAAGPNRVYNARRQNSMSIMASAPSMRPRRSLAGGGQRSPMAKRGTERSRTREATVDVAASIRNISAREAFRRAALTPGVAKASISNESQKEDVSQDLPRFLSPEHIVSDLGSVLSKVPSIASPRPSLSHAHKKLSPALLKCTYGGDYSKYQLDTQDYLRGSRGVGHTYARIVVERNGTLSQNSRKKLHRFIEKGTRGPRRPISMA